MLDVSCWMLEEKKMKNQYCVPILGTVAYRFTTPSVFLYFKRVKTAFYSLQNGH
jgi:hypothetical protein